MTIWLPASQLFLLSHTNHTLESYLPCFICHSAEFDEYGDAQLLHNAGNDVSEQNVVHLTGRYRTRTEDLSVVRVIEYFYTEREYFDSQTLLPDATVGRFCRTLLPVARRYCWTPLPDDSSGSNCQTLLLHASSESYCQKLLPVTRSYYQTMLLDASAG